MCSSHQLTGGECDIYNTLLEGATPHSSEAIEMPFLTSWQLQMFATRAAQPLGDRSLGGGYGGGERSLGGGYAAATARWVEDTAAATACRVEDTVAATARWVEDTATARWVEDTAAATARWVEDTATALGGGTAIAARRSTVAATAAGRIRLTAQVEDTATARWVEDDDRPRWEDGRPHAAEDRR
jgi:hypothetical protein